MVLELSRLIPRERVSLNRGPIEGMCRTLGAERAEALVGGAMEELAVWVSRSEKLCRAGNRDELGRLARLTSTVGLKLGMDDLARVSDAVAELAPHSDEATLAAVTARMVRVGEGSLVAIWELQGLSV
jgi:hypothetical protein